MVEKLVIAALLGTLALGVLVGFQYLARARRPALVSTHLALGALGTVAVAFVLLRDGGVAGSWALLLLGGATFLGLVAGLIWKRHRGRAEALLVVHIVAGIAGFLVALSWLRRGGGLG
jgi:uncharacterized membrane protein